MNPQLPVLPAINNHLSTMLLLTHKGLSTILQLIVNHLFTVQQRFYKCLSAVQTTKTQSRYTSSSHNTPDPQQFNNLTTIYLAFLTKAALAKCPHKDTHTHTLVCFCLYVLYLLIYAN